MRKGDQSAQGHAQTAHATNIPQHSGYQDLPGQSERVCSISSWWWLSPNFGARLPVGGGE